MRRFLVTFAKFVFCTFSSFAPHPFAASPLPRFCAFCRSVDSTVLYIFLRSEERESGCSTESARFCAVATLVLLPPTHDRNQQGSKRNQKKYKCTGLCNISATVPVSHTRRRKRLMFDSTPHTRSCLSISSWLCALTRNKILSSRAADLMP
jgi:hypothetical protein